MNLLNAINIQDRISIKIQNLLCLAICVVMFYPLFNFFFVGCFDLFPPIKEKMDMVLFVFESAILLLALIFCFITNPQGVILPYVLAAFAISFSIIYNPATWEHIQGMLKNLLVFSIPMSFIPFMIEDYEKFRNTLFKASYIIFFISIPTGLSVGRSLEYSMWFSYSLLVPLLFITLKQFVHYKVYDTLVVLIMLVLIVTFGSRGALFSWGAALCVLALWKLKETRKSRNLNKNVFAWLIILIVVALAAIVLFLAYVNIIYVNPSNVSSRTIRLIMSGILFYDAGRIPLYKAAWKFILENPFGYGITGEMVEFQKIGFGPTYTHNMVLDLWVHYGIVIGSLFIVSIVILVIAFFRHNKDPGKKLLFMAIAPAELFTLFVSSSYIQSSLLWFCLAICICGIKGNRKIRSIYEKTT